MVHASSAKPCTVRCPSERNRTAQALQNIAFACRLTLVFKLHECGGNLNPSGIYTVSAARPPGETWRLKRLV